MMTGGVGSPEAPKVWKNGDPSDEKEDPTRFFQPPPFGRKAGKFLHLATKILSFFFLASLVVCVLGVAASDGVAVSKWSTGSST